MPSLRRDEAERRAALVSVDSYHIDLDLTLSPEDGFASRTRVRFRGEPGATTFADVQARAVLQSSLNGRPLANPLDGRLVLPELAASNELVVDAVMTYSHDGEGLHRHLDPADGRAYVYAMSFLDAAPRWFACFDQPDLKAPVSLRVLCPDDWTVAGNGPATSVAPGTWKIAPTHPLATYFTTVVAGPYHSVRRTHDGIDLVLHVRQSLRAHLDRDADELFEHTARCFDELHRLFDVRYPWGEYHQAFVPDFNAGAMENAGCVTLRDALVFRSRATRAQRADRANTMTHELAHMWFGNLVTMRWWDDLWLNESFAEYLGYRVDATIGMDGSWADFGIVRKPRGLRDDRGPSTHPVAGNAAADAASALNEFDGISYMKGASVLRQLAAQLGDEVLLGGLRRHFAAHRFGTATFADLMASLTAAGARDLDGWADQWLRTSGLDTLRAEPTTDGSVLSRISDAHRPHAVAVAAFAADGTSLARERILLAEPVTVTHPPAALVLPDAGDETWAKIEIANWSAVPRLLPALDLSARIAVWNALRLAVADAEVDPWLALDVVEAAATEGDTVLRHVLTWATQSLASRCVAPRHSAEVFTRVAGVARRSLAASAPGSSVQLAAARSLVAASTDSAELSGWLGADAPKGLVVDADLRWLVLTRMAALGDLTAAEIAEAGAADSSSEGRVHAARSHAARPDAAAKREAWELLIHDTTLSNYELYAVAEGFWQPGQDDLTDPYVPRYFADIAATAQLRSGWVVSRIAEKAFPWTAVAPETLQLAEEFIARDNISSGVRRAVVDAADDLRRALAVRARFPR